MMQLNSIRKARVRVDAEQVRQVLMNLVTNALQAVAGRGTVTICTRRRPERAPDYATGSSGNEIDWAEVSVSDDGPGILPQVVEHIFVPFFTTKHKGTGLGLAISQRMIEEMGGGHFGPARRSDLRDCAASGLGPSVDPASQPAVSSRVGAACAGMMTRVPTPGPFMWTRTTLDPICRARICFFLWSLRGRPKSLASLLATLSPNARQTRSAI